MLHEAVVKIAGCLRCGLRKGLSMPRISDIAPLKPGLAAGTNRGVTTSSALGQAVLLPLGLVAVMLFCMAQSAPGTGLSSEYERKLAAIDPNNADARYILGKWAYDNHQLEAARTELKAALELRPRFERARLLLRLVESSLAPVSRPAAKSTQAAVTPRAAETPEASSKMYVGQEDIYRIRLEELKADDIVKVEFRNNVVERFLTKMRGQGDFAEPAFEVTFKGYGPVQKASYMLTQIAPDDSEIKDDILIKTDPAAMRDFRIRIWPIVRSYCASSRCHGAEGGKGGVRFIVKPGADERMVYTNFLILDGTAIKGKRIVDRDHPEESLLLQYGLPVSASTAVHPVTIRQLYTDTNAQNYRTIYDWIETLAGPPHPNYRLAYKPPFGMNLDFGRPKPPPEPNQTQSSQPPQQPKSSEPNVVY